MKNDLAYLVGLCMLYGMLLGYLWGRADGRDSVRRWWGK